MDEELRTILSQLGNDLRSAIDGTVEKKIGLFVGALHSELTGYSNYHDDGGLVSWYRLMGAIERAAGASLMGQK